MFNNYITVCHGRTKKNRKVYIWSIFIRMNRKFDTGDPIHRIPLRVVRSRNSVYFVVRFPLSEERNVHGCLDTKRESSIGDDSESLLAARPSHIWWDYKNYAQDIIYALCAIEPSFLHSLNVHYPYNSINPYPCWDDSNYSYPSLIRRRTNVCGHSAIYRKFIVVEWVSDERKKM